MMSDEVARYLQENPQFFETHAEMISRLVIPHPHGGRTISITERQLLSLREKNRQLEDKLSELLQFGEENDALGEKMHRLAVAVAAADSFAALLDALERPLRDDFAIPHVALRLWGHDARVDPARPELFSVGAEMKAFAETLAVPYCGPAADGETTAWFGEAARRIRSQALVALRCAHGTIGLLALGSEDPRRFHAGLGALYLKRLGELAAAAFQRTLGRY